MHSADALDTDDWQGCIYRLQSAIDDLAPGGTITFHATAPDGRAGVASLTRGQALALVAAMRKNRGA